MSGPWVEHPGAFGIVPHLPYTPSASDEALDRVVMRVQAGLWAGASGLYEALQGPDDVPWDQAGEDVMAKFFTLACVVVDNYHRAGRHDD